MGIGEICERLGPVLVDGEVTPNIRLVCRSKSLGGCSAVLVFMVVVGPAERELSSSPGPKSTSPLPTYGSTLGSPPSSNDSFSWLYPSTPFVALRRFLLLDNNPSIKPKMRRPPMIPPTIPPIAPPDRPEDLSLAHVRLGLTD